MPWDCEWGLELVLRLESWGQERGWELMEWKWGRRLARQKGQ
jgi:hypothetical protein